jgi:hypothetical protein
VPNRSISAPKWIDRKTASNKRADKHPNLASVLGQSGVDLAAACTSLLMTSGRNPSVSIASAVRMPNEPLPCPMSKITPRRRASGTSSRICPSSFTGALGNGRKQCVRMSPRRQAREHFEPAGRRVVEVRHNRKPGLFGDLERNVEGCHP